MGSTFGLIWVPRTLEHDALAFAHAVLAQRPDLSHDDALALARAPVPAFELRGDRTVVMHLDAAHPSHPDAARGRLSLVQPPTRTTMPQTHALSATQQRQAIEKQLDDAAVSIWTKRPELTFAQAYVLALEEHPDLMKAHRDAKDSECAKVQRRDLAPAAAGSAEARLDAKAKQLSAEKGLTYAAAYALAADQDPTLFRDAVEGR